ncbi:TPA: phage major capsid protein [Streptococcus suis]|nr:phage major capsid protein [Streptococcus suis]
MPYYSELATNYRNALNHYFRGIVAKEDEAPLASGRAYENHFYKLPNGAYDLLIQHNLFRRLGTVYQRLNSTITLHMLKPAQDSVNAIHVGEAYLVDPVRESNQSIDAHKLGTILLVNRDTVLDMTFDINAYLSSEFAKQFGQKEEQLCLLGTGKGEPSGLLNQAEVGMTVSELTFDSLKQLYLSLKPEHRHHGTWLMSDETKLLLHQLVDKNNQPIFPYGAKELFGRPIETSPYMPNTGKVIAFGDMSKYWLIERHLLCVRALKEPYIMEGRVGYQAMERIDGHLTHADAIKVLELTE